MHLSNSCQTSQFIPELRSQSEKMRRSTLAQRGDQLELAEMAEPMVRLQDQEGEIEDERSRVLTL